MTVRQIDGGLDAPYRCGLIIEPTLFYYPHNSTRRHALLALFAAVKYADDTLRSLHAIPPAGPAFADVSRAANCLRCRGVTRTEAALKPLSSATAQGCDDHKRATSTSEYAGQLTMRGLSSSASYPLKNTTIEGDAKDSVLAKSFTICPSSIRAAVV